MQDVQLQRPTIDASGARRHPAEGVITVDDETANRWRAGGHLAEEDDDGLDDLKVAELDKIVAEETVEVASNASKTDKIAAIRAHRAAAK